MACSSDSQLLSAYDARVRDQLAKQHLANSTTPPVTDVRSARPAQSASAMAESTRRPFGKSSSFMSRVVDRKRMRRVPASCLASCPTAYCRSGRNTDRNNKRPTCSEVRVLFSLQRGLVHDSILHTGISTLPRRACQPGILHDIFDQLRVGHQPKSVRRSFQHPTQKVQRRRVGSETCTSLKSKVFPMSSVSSLTLVCGPTITSSSM